MPQAVRQVFTYSVNDQLDDQVCPGKRVWVPLGRRKAIGIVVGVTDKKPDFACKAIVEVLDEEPVMSSDLLELTAWVSKYYYSGWGEVIQAALPGGLNYVADRFVSVRDRNQSLTTKETEVCDEIQGSGEMDLREAEQQWSSRTIQSMLSRGILELYESPRQKIKSRYVKAYVWDETQAQNAFRFFESWTGRAYQWIGMIPFVFAMSPPVTRRDLTSIHGVSEHTLKRLEQEGYIDPTEVEVASDPEFEFDYAPDRLRPLNEEQQKVFSTISHAIDHQKFSSFLLHGVTGSGKTEVYIHALKKVLEQGRGALVLVPEISLTPQTVRRFYEIFGDTIAVLHSRLSDRERYEAWKKLKSGEKMIAIGARSAVFAPIRDPGIIIIDEEHDQSYKQEDPAPRYHAREVALMRAFKGNIPVVMGSATPSLGSLYGVTRKKHTLLSLSARHSNALLPKVKILDLRQYRNAMFGPLAVPLYQAIGEAIGRKEQVILLYNRRGYASYLQCGDCGHISECPNCSVSMTYHRYYQSLKCHYCGYGMRMVTSCEKCSSPSIDLSGSGTQKIEEEIAELFTEARLLRMDRDSTTGKNAHHRILKHFAAGEADILLGTQLVAKGLDFPNVTVVGVVDADTELAFPSYKSSERMFQLLTQVAGRAGRAEKEGVVYLQTKIPDHPSLVHASTHDFDTFARVEIRSRKELLYPPFSRLVHFQFKSENQKKVQEVAFYFTNLLIRSAGRDQVLGPAPAVIEKMYNDFRWESYLKVSPDTGTQKMEYLLDRLFKQYDLGKPKGASAVRINVNVDA